jgi:hypothetical protein
MPPRPVRFLACLASLVAAGGMAFLVLMVCAEPPVGDLARLGFFSETAHGWQGAQAVFDPPLAQPGRTDGSYDVVVLGDSFSQRTDRLRQTPAGGFWTDFLAAETGWSVGIFDLATNDPEALLAAPVLAAHPPRLFVLEVVERQLFRFDRDGPCPTPDTALPLSMPGGDPPQLRPFARVRDAWPDATRAEYQLAFLRANLLRLAGIETTDARRLTPDRADLFTSRDPAILVYARDFDRAHWSDAAWTRIACRLRALQSAVERNGVTAFRLLVAPDKSTAYARHLPPTAHVPDTASRLPGLALVPAEATLVRAIDAGVRDVYLPDDTHWGSAGAQAVVAALRQTARQEIALSRP